MKLSIKSKLIATFLAVGLIPFISIGLISLFKSSAEIENQAFQKLTAIREIKKSGIERYFNTIRDQVLTLSEDRMVIDAMQEFTTAFANYRAESNVSDDQIKTLRSDLSKYYIDEFAVEFGKQNDGNKVDVGSLYGSLDKDSVALQHAYIKANPNALGEKHLLDSASDKSAYGKAHAKYHPAIRSFLEKFGYYDIFLVDHTSGDIVYSVFKELDYTTSLIDGPYADTNFAEAFRAAKELTKAGEFIFKDFKQYLPSYNAPASFIAAPIFEGGQKVGVLIFQMPLDRITAVMSERAGLGETGETYLVGSDNLMRSDSYLDQKNRSVVASFRNPEKGKVETEGAKNALAGKSGAEILTDYNGNPVLSAYSPVDILGVKWALLAEIDESEALAAEAALIWLMMVLGIGGAVAIACLGYMVARYFSNPITAMTSAMKELAEGNHDIEVPARDRTDEIGDMSDAVEVFKVNAIRNRELEAEQEQQKQRAEEEKRKMLNQLADNFDASVGSIVETVSSASAELTSTAQSMASISEETSNRASSVAAASEEASTNVQTVATAAEEMSASIAEINSQVAQAADVSKQAVENVTKTSTQIDELSETADKVGAVVSMISDIAEQTNLLALNATIESARAGEAGKGFAVVASEVKALANETAKATEEIAAHIQRIQGATKGAVASIVDIGSVVSQLEETSTVIAAAMEEQGATTQEISRNVQEAATGTKDVSANITSVTQASQEAGSASSQVTSAAKELSEQSELMKAQVEKFLSQIRAA